MRDPAPAAGVPHAERRFDTGEGRGTSTAAGATPAAETLTDGQVLEVVRTANAGEIEQAKLAQSKAQNATVKKFAAMMVKEHGDANTKADALARKASIEPKASTLSASLASEAKEATAEMSALKGAAFDKAYVDAQVREHQSVLTAIETKLLPATQSADVKGLLASVRDKVTHHLTEAKAMQATLAKAMTASTK